MPYIPEYEREKFEECLKSMPFDELWAEEPGVLNYLVTRLVNRFLGHEPRYTRLNAAIGVLEAAKLELYRRVVAGYEDTKARENGDVYSQGLR